MKKIAKIRIDKTKYEIDLRKFYDLSIPIDPNKKSPSFYDKNPLDITYYKSKDKTWSIKKGATCNIPIIDMNIHCGTTHVECRSHITDEDLTILETIKDSFIPSILISVKPEKNINNETYHYQIEKNDLIITESILKEKLKKYNLNGVRSLVIRTLPNSKNDLIIKDYNLAHNAFFSNEAISYLKSIKIEHLIVDLPSIDKFDDGGYLGNHRIFWDIDKNPNHNTITELAFIKNSIKDGGYLISLNILNLKLDASPCRPIIYPILKQR